MSRICINPHVPSSGREHVAPARDTRLHTECPIGRGSRKYGDRGSGNPPCVHARLDIRAHFWTPVREWCDVTRRDATRRDATRGEARRGEARRGEATRPFDVELALHGGRDNVARVHSPSPWLSRRVSLFQVWTCDERVAIRKTHKLWRYHDEFTLT